MKKFKKMNLKLKNYKFQIKTTTLLLLFIIIKIILKIYSINDTLDEIIINNKSISRFGDGEFSLMYGENNLFQEYNKSLKKKLIKILRSNEKNLLIGINIPYSNKSLEKYNKYAKNFYYNLINKNKFKIFKL